MKTKTKKIDHNYRLVIVGNEQRLGMGYKISLLYVSSNYENSWYYGGADHEFHGILYWLTQAGESRKAMAMPGTAQDSEAAIFLRRLNAAARMVWDGKSLDEAIAANPAA
jgi:hypothetical protein